MPFKVQVKTSRADEIEKNIQDLQTKIIQDKSYNIKNITYKRNGETLDLVITYPGSNPIFNKILMQVFKKSFKGVDPNATIKGL